MKSKILWILPVIPLAFWALNSKSSEKPAEIEINNSVEKPRLSTKGLIQPVEINYQGDKSGAAPSEINQESSEKLTRELSNVDNYFVNAYKERGFSDEQAETIGRYLKEAYRHRTEDGRVEMNKAIEAAGEELKLPETEIDKLHEANLKAFFQTLSSVPLEKAEECLKNRINYSSDCTKNILDEFLSLAKKHEFNGDVDTNSEEIQKLEKMATLGAVRLCGEDQVKAKALFIISSKGCEPIN